MKTITRSCIRLDANAATKDEAIYIAGQLLADAGYIESGYIDSLLRREQVANTFLGSGVAIPHGMIDDRHLIHHTGIAILQLPNGVEWNAGQKAYLVVAIAAQSDEHIGLLRRLTRLMQQPDAIDALVHAHNPLVLMTALGDAPVPTATPAPEIASAWPADAEAAWTVDYPNGLHARPATRWVEIAKRFPCELRVYKDAEFADAKTLTDLLALGITCGVTLRLAARGPDALRALNTLLDTVRGLSAVEQADAERARQNALAVRKTKPDWTPSGAPRTLYGLGASPGLAVGKLVRHVSPHIDVTDQPGDVVAEGEALEQALLAVRAEREELEGRTRQRLSAAEAAIFAAQRELLADPVLTRDALATIMQGHGAAWSWQRALRARIDKLQQVSDPLLAARAVDLRDVGERVLAQLLGIERQQLALSEPSILAADDLTPSDTLHLDTRHVVGLATSVGGPTSHTAILARTLGLPAIVAAGPALLTVPEGGIAVLDGGSGCLYVDVSEADQRSVVEVIARQVAARESLRAIRHLPATTTDGHTVEIAANVANPKQASVALDAGAEGIGLMRTEFLFLERDKAPDEEEQYQVYREMVEVTAGRRLIIRTLDIGGDKQVPYLDLPREENPFLGVRGARLLLQRQDLLYAQLRALYRAAQHGPLWIMFPMVTHVSEIEALRGHCELAREQVKGPEVKLGIMVEVPAVAVMADRFAAMVDFFSIGTNDLTQYTLAVDRQHPELAAQADSLHPAVLALIDATVRGAQAAGRSTGGGWVGVCGGLAGDPLGARILTGLGVDELSMSAQDIAPVKAALRGESRASMQALAQRALRACTAAEVRAL
ncbi:MAG TPA: phosphoenolpyruvate--protein phosphotransferase [Candidatus Competibacteraceae bacterium]|nr:MAG: phosphoenolpyruvate--protein phosphotransferase [Candidatus Competibacteraceae bacterium]HOB63369.1 phosphoenolpyruvate--protein phosphotransferase [Candidatus Competibacteraceae bacterium]HQA27232.1 phosphoenolpyruvate--protein phosphotransferase [Candidatus Competibacteraceae bacterium]